MLLIIISQVTVCTYTWFRINKYILKLQKMNNSTKRFTHGQIYLSSVGNASSILYMETYYA